MEFSASMPGFARGRASWSSFERAASKLSSQPVAVAAGLRNGFLHFALSGTTAAPNAP